MSEIKNENVKIESKEKSMKLPKENGVDSEEGRGTEAKEKEINIEHQEQKEQISHAGGIAYPEDDEKDVEKIKNDIKKIKDLDTSRQVKVLVVLAFDKGVLYSIEVAKRLSKELDNPYLLDEFHDKLSTKFYEELVKAKKLKEI